MSDSTQLVPKNVASGPLAKYDYGSVTSGGEFLSRLQLFGSNSTAVKEDKIGMGHWGLVKDQDTIVDLGPEVDGVLLSWRPKALQTDNENNVIIAYKPDDPIFVEVRARAEQPDSGCMYGPEFLVWLPGISEFVTYFANSKTARREARKIESLLGQAVTFKCRLIKTTRYTWHGPVIIKCSSPLDVPAIEDIQEQCDKFQNPPAPEVELAQESNEDRER